MIYFKKYINLYDICFTHPSNRFLNHWFHKQVILASKLMRLISDLDLLYDLFFFTLQISKLSIYTRETRLATWHTFWHAFFFANTRHSTWLALICATLLPYGIDVGIIFSMPLCMTYGSHLA